MVTLKTTFNLDKTSQAPYVFDPKAHHALIVLESRALSRWMFHEAYRLG